MANKEQMRKEEEDRDRERERERQEHVLDKQFPPVGFLVGIN